MEYIYDVINWASGKRVDTFTRWEELHNVDFSKCFVLVFRGESPRDEYVRIMDKDSCEGWILARLS